MKLALRGVRCVLPGRPDREPVDVQVGDGARVCLVGGSGEGKSLLLRLVLGRVPPAPLGVEGSVELDGEVLPATRDGLAPLRAQRGSAVAWLPQGGRENLVPGWTLQRQLAALVPAARHERARELMATLGLDPSARVLGALATALSEGMIRRALLAMALAAEPSLLVLDEPTTGLDPAASSAVAERLEAVAGSTDLLLATHDLDLAERIGTRFVRVQHGCPVAVTDSLEAAAFDDFRAARVALQVPA